MFRTIRYLILLVESVGHAPRQVLVEHEFDGMGLVLVILLLPLTIFKLI